MNQEQKDQPAENVYADGDPEVYSWFFIETALGNRFIEVSLPPLHFQEQVEQGGCVAVSRQVFYGPTMDPTTRMPSGTAYLREHKAVPQFETRLEDWKTVISTRHILSFSLVDLGSELWKKIEEAALREEGSGVVSNEIQMGNIVVPRPGIGRIPGGDGQQRS